MLIGKPPFSSCARPCWKQCTRFDSLRDQGKTRLQEMRLLWLQFVQQQALQYCAILFQGMLGEVSGFSVIGSRQPPFCQFVLSGRCAVVSACTTASSWS